MKITRILIKNFRSLEHVEIRCTDFNLFVGQNNSGKTNIFEALEWFFGAKADISEITYLKDTKREVLVEVEFSGAQHGMSRMKNESNQTKIANALGDSDTIVINRSGTDAKKRTVLVNNQEVKPGTGFDAALNDFLPRFEYVNTKQYYDAVAKYDKKAPIGAMLSGVLATILESNRQYLDLQERLHKLFHDDKSEIKIEFDKIGHSVKLYLERQFPDCTKVRFEVDPPDFEDLLKRFDTTIDDGVETFAEEKGDGMQRALMLAIIQAYADFRKSQEDAGKSFIFFIDEAELHLHPMAQRKLKNVLLQLADKLDQVFINTHSSVFVADDHPKQSIFMVEKQDKATIVEPVSPHDKPYVVYELLGGSPQDLLLPRNFLIVEGKSEVELLSRVISRHYQDKPPIQLIPAHGDTDQVERTINAIEKVFTPLNASLYASKAVILCDKPSAERQAGVKDFLIRHKVENENKQIKFLPVPAIEEYYPARNGWRKTHDEQEAMDGKKKRQLAKRVGNEVTKAEFEADLSEVFSALTRCWELAY
jgi:putative ATP-dependent endonuclease of the OLD family